MRKLLAWAGVATLALFCAAQRADANGSALKPYVVLVLDTSGSMAEATGSGAPSCGGADTKLNHAKCAINKIANSYGDIVFALGRFRQLMGGTTTPATFPSGCCTSGPGVGANGACAANGACNTADSTMEMLTGLVDGSNSASAVWANGTANTCTATGTDPEIWNADSNTPLEGALKGAKRYWQGLQATDARIILANTAPGFNPIVNDPLATTFLPSGAQCRPYITILLTDGAETCGGTPNNGASAMLSTQVTVGGSVRNYRIETKPIGFGIAPGNAQIEGIAHAGGAADAPGVNEGYYASDEAGLELAISQIIEDAVHFETCNNLDDDCDGKIDEDFPNKGGTCTNGQQGVCARTGTFVCSGDQTGTVCNAPAVTPGVEICNGLDDDCDGKIDEGVPGCNCVAQAETCNNMDDDCDGKIDEGIVKQCGQGTCLGTQTCNAGVFGACTAKTPTTEICNGIDDDCDGVADGLEQDCSNLVTPGGPASDNPGTKAACMAEGTKCLCHPGNKICPAGGNGTFGSCTGEVVPTVEICNGIDDDCDGKIDEGTGGADCSTNCGIGQTVCVNGAITCNSMPSTTDDTCDNNDDDCDGKIDENYVPVPCTQGGTVCNGMTKCVAGVVQCDGQPIVTESCNCTDDDCDGKVDENPNCPAGSTCSNCQCAFPCGSGEFPCPLGKTCSVDHFCIADPCYGISCPAKNGHAQECVAQNNLGTCVDVCSVTTCASPLVCVPETGQCAPNDCSTFPAMCNADQNCINGMCIANPCQGVTCPTDQYCEQGQCYSSCAGVTCPSGQRCALGTCEADPCGKACPAGQVCNDNTGTCEANPCPVIKCPTGQYCNPNQGGQCQNDPCIGTTCPDPAQTCLGGTCYDPSQFQPDGGVEEHVTTGGGGGCNTGGGNTGLLVGLSLGLLALRRRKGVSL